MLPFLWKKAIGRSGFLHHRQGYVQEVSILVDDYT
ncbi:unnamed protein product [Gulo gulo]|uniref:Uncharacterized protein n=1 Tax=Gulo gulo TaxID=48420 RepID=A0A9X9LCG0_GULGU|nr:unnamed protein product [Gulo gulo]